MAINNGDFVRLNFTGKIKENDEIFDTTFEDVAKEAGLFDENKEYKPIPIIVGGNHLLPAIEEAIVGLEAGDSKTIEIDSENAFGPRNKQLIQLIPMKEFKRQGMTPVPGMKITSEGSTGKNRNSHRFLWTHRNGRLLRRQRFSGGSVSQGCGKYPAGEVISRLASAGKPPLRITQPEQQLPASSRERLPGNRHFRTAPGGAADSCPVPVSRRSGA